MAVPSPAIQLASHRLNEPSLTTCRALHAQRTPSLTNCQSNRLVVSHASSRSEVDAKARSALSRKLPRGCPVSPPKRQEAWSKGRPRYSDALCSQADGQRACHSQDAKHEGICRMSTVLQHRRNKSRHLSLRNFHCLPLRTTYSQSQSIDLDKQWRPIRSSGQ